MKAKEGRGGWSQETKLDEAPKMIVPVQEQVVHVQEGITLDLGDFNWARWRTSLTLPVANGGGPVLYQEALGWVMALQEVTRVARLRGQWESVPLWPRILTWPWMDFGFEAGVTVNMKGFQSARIDVGLEVRGVPGVWHNRVVEWIYWKLLAEEAEICAQENKPAQLTGVVAKKTAPDWLPEEALARVSLQYGVTIKRDAAFLKPDVGASRFCQFRDINVVYEAMAKEFKQKIREAVAKRLMPQERVHG